MAADVHKQLGRAEGLLKQGKLQPALRELDLLAKNSGGDLLTLNRIGDLLAKQKHRDEAVGYYRPIAERFSEQGFYPKAIAIFKKMLRLLPEDPGCLAQLGSLYVSQKLPSESRSYFLKAAEGYLATQDFSRAREVYEQLVQAEPGDHRHRARLAEARAAEGEPAAAGADLLLLGEELLARDQPKEAEQAYRRAGELLPDQPGPVLGIARCMSLGGQQEAALELLEQSASPEFADPTVLGELALQYERAGRVDDAVGVFQRSNSAEIPTAAFAEMLKFHLVAESSDSQWERLDSMLDGWRGGAQEARVAAVLDELTEVEEHGHLPALLRLYECNQREGGAHRSMKTLERLIDAYRARSMDDEANAMVEELSNLVTENTEPVDDAAQAKAPVDGSVDVASDSADGELPTEAEAPAVPLSRSDDEYASGRLTQSEILEKYGLRKQALEQVREVTQRFPGHLPAQQRLVGLLREGSTSAELAQALVGLALACRASGDVEAGRRSAAEATTIGGLPDATSRTLDELGLIAGMAADPEPEDEVPLVIEGNSVASAPAKRTPAVEEALVIDFDDGASAPIEAAPVAKREGAAPSRPVREPSEDMLQAIREQIESGDNASALRAMDQLVSLGYAGSALDALRADAAQEASPERPLVLDDDDLGSITAALESELFQEEEVSALSASPDPESEESLEDVFAAFKQHVEQEVDGEDFRTHYDLGIAYKEMGLLDEAVDQFKVSMRSPLLYRESCSMLAMCHRERLELEEAADWYRQALEASVDDDGELSGLRYDLAETLLQSGDRNAALTLFRDVSQVDPTYRDVQNRIAELETA